MDNAIFFSTEQSFLAIMLINFVLSCHIVVISREWRDAHLGMRVQQRADDNWIGFKRCSSNSAL